MSSPHRVYLWLVTREVGLVFRACDAPVALTNKEKSSACNHLRSIGALEVIGKRSSHYLYRYLGPVEGHRWVARPIQGDHTGMRRDKPTRILRMSDFPTVTGRFASGQPEMQDLRPRAPRHLPDVDYSRVEERIALNYSIQMEEGNRLLDEMSRARTLAECTDDELFAELRRRLNHGN